MSGLSGVFPPYCLLVYFCFQNNPCGVTFLCILSLGVISKLITYRAAGHGGPGSMCDRSGWRWVHLHGPCWTSLIKLQADATWYDIIHLTGYAEALLCSLIVVLLRCKCCSKMPSIERCFRRIILTLGFVMVLSAFGNLYIYVQQYKLSDHMAVTISGQLSESLQLYGNDDIITRAWQNTMLDGCCCGMQGYQDFTNIDMEVSPYCGCYKEQQPDLYKGCSQLSRIGCAAEPNTNITNKGCLEFVFHNTSDNAMTITGIQIMFTFLTCAAFIKFTANAKVVCIYTATSADDFEEISQNKQEVEPVYIFKGPLLLKLVCISYIYQCMHAIIKS